MGHLPRRGRRSEGREAKLLPGGFQPGTMKDGLLYDSKELPQRIHQQDQVTQGVCAFKGPATGGGPSGSPPLGFKLTRDAIWTLNPDGTLYEEVLWSNVRRLEVRDSGDNSVWSLKGTFIRAEFMILQVEPSPGTAQALVDLVREKGIEVDVATE